jgi:hypothetical protein
MKFVLDGVEIVYGILNVVISNAVSVALMCRFF